MPLRIQCPGCQTRLQIADANQGQKVRCPKCNGIMQIPAAPVAAFAPASAPLAARPSTPPPEAVTTEPLVRQRPPTAPSLEITPPMALPVHRPPEELDLVLPLSARRPSSVKK